MTTSLFSNVERRKQMFADDPDQAVRLMGVEPKTVYTFDQGGGYSLQVRDITLRYGDPSFRYRILVRPEIPHVGDVSMPEGDHLNLIRGKSRKVVVTASYEEGFTGDVSIEFSGLPEGVQALPSVQFDEEQVPMEITQNADAIAAKLQKTSIILMASASAPITPKPAMIQVYCQPIVGGKLGRPFLVRELPMMVLEDVH